MLYFKVKIIEMKIMKQTTNHVKNLQVQINEYLQFNNGKFISCNLTKLKNDKIN